jgi:aldehyde dehydrogenase (NAD+)
MAAETEPPGGTRERIAQRHAEAAETLKTDQRMFVDGEWVEAGSGSRIAVHDPTTGEQLTTVPEAGEADVDTAVAAAGRAYDETWSESTASERQTVLNAVADRVEEASERLATIETLENGKPLSLAKGLTAGVADHFRYFAGAARTNQGTTVPAGTDQTVMTFREPYGVVGTIIPWNFPMLTAAWKVAPALATGNTVVLKPAEETPLSMLALLEEVADVLPDGVLNVVTGRGEPTGAALASHPGVDKLSFTGSTEVGKAVMHSAAEDVTDVTLELGGKSPLIVFDDADVELAGQVAADAIFSNTGEDCTAASRLFVHADVKDAVLDALIAAAEEYVPGDPLVESTTLGPKVSVEQCERTLGYVEAARQDGATISLGGEPPEADSLAPGSFVQPTVIKDIAHDHEAVQEEIFGPVLTVFEWTDYDEMMTLANDVDYGLAAGVVTENVNAAHRTARDLEAGTVWVNQYQSFPAGMPFGGYKESGIGRETALETLDVYTQTKSVNLSIAGTEDAE